MDTLQSLLPDLALKGGLLLLLALLVDAALRRASAATRHAHWQLALGGALALALLLPLLPRVSITLPLPAVLAQAGTWFGTEARPSGAALAAHASPGLPPVNPAHASPASHAAPAAAAEDAVAPLGASRKLPRLEAPPAARVPLHQAQDRLAGTAPIQAGGAADTGAAFARLDVGDWLTLAWAVGAAVVLVLLGCSVLRARALARAAQPLRDAGWLALLDRTAGELSLKRRVTLLIADGPVVPMTWGHARPVILLPADAHAWSAPRRRQVLLHELAHIQRGDWLTQLLAQVACALYWYQPLAWLAARRLRQQREHACDDRVLAAGNRASDYAGHLLDIARTRQAGLTGSFATLAMARPSQLEGRLLAVLDERRNRRALPGRRTLAAAAVAGTLVLALACVQPESSADKDAPADAPVLQVLNQRGFGRPAQAADGAFATAAAQEETTPAPMTVMTMQDGTVLQAAGPIHSSARGLSLTTPPRAGRQAVAPRAFAVAGMPRDGDPFAPMPAMPALDTTSFPALAPLAALAPFGDAADWELQIGHEWDGSSEWTWSEGEDSFHVTLRDWIEPDETATKLGYVGDGAELVIERTHAGTTDRIEVTGGGEDENGNSVWQLAGTLGGATAGAPALQAELDRLLPTVLAHTAIFAGQRVNYLLDNGGVTAVLAEAGALPVESARVCWYSVLLQEHELGTPDTTAVLTQAGRDLPGDAYLAELLGEVGPELLADPDLAAPLFSAVDTLDSDSYQAEVLECLLCCEYVDSPVLVLALTSAAAGLESDSYAAEVLASVPGARLRDPAVRQAFLTAFDTVGSDSYAAEILEPLLDQRGVKGESLAALLAAAATAVDSDAYLAGILQSLPGRALADDRVRAAALVALASIESDAYGAEVLIAFLDSGDVPPDALGDLLDAARSGLDSDAYAADVLSNMPPAALSNPAVRPAFDAALATIESPSYREAVLDELGLQPQGD